MFGQFFLGSVLCIVFVVTLPWMVRDRRVRFPLIQLAFSLAGSLLVAVVFWPTIRRRWRQPCSYCWCRRCGICDVGRSRGARWEFF